MKSGIIVARKGHLTNALYNSIKDDVKIIRVYHELPRSKSEILTKRIKKLGILKVLDQIVFLLIISPLLKITSNQRIDEIIQEHDLNIGSIPQDLVENITSVNSDTFIQILQQTHCDYTFVNGTRIIHKKTIEASSGLWLNIHVGITPTYRGVHGGYWAVANNDLEKFGVTLHKIDSGIDTGDIIAQSRIHRTKKDNYATYPVLQYAFGIRLLKDFLQGKEPKLLKNRPNNSRLHYHPGFTEYLKNRITRNLK